MNIAIHENITSNGSKGFKAGYAIIEGVHVEKSSKPLKKEINAAIKRVAEKYPDTKTMYSSPAISGMREMFRSKGVDPTKLRPSAEALQKRIIDGKGLYRINNGVDLNNLGSLLYELPMGVYNLDALKGDVCFKFGEKNEQMETMAKGSLNVHNILVTADSEKLFGSPVSDSNFAKITEEVENIILLVYGPCNVDKEYVYEATEFTAKKIAFYGNAHVTGIEVVCS